MQCVPIKDLRDTATFDEMVVNSSSLLSSQKWLRSFRMHQEL